MTALMRLYTFPGRRLRSITNAELHLHQPRWTGSAISTSCRFHSPVVMAGQHPVGISIPWWKRATVPHLIMALPITIRVARNVFLPLTPDPAATYAVDYARCCRQVTPTSLPRSEASDHADAKEVTPLTWIARSNLLKIMPCWSRIMRLCREIGRTLMEKGAGWRLPTWRCSPGTVQKNNEKVRLNCPGDRIPATSWRNPLCAGHFDQARLVATAG